MRDVGGLLSLSSFFFSFTALSINSTKMSQKYEPFPLHPVLQHLFQESLNVSPEEVTQPAVVRKGFDQQAAALLSVPDNVLRETREITAGPHGAKVTITIIRPVGSENATLPAILFLHGGGWVFGSLNTHGSLVYEASTLDLYLCTFFFFFVLTCRVWAVSYQDPCRCYFRRLCHEPRGCVPDCVGAVLCCLVLDTGQCGNDQD